MRKMLIILILVSLITPTIAENNNSTYRVHVDQSHGFYRVYKVYNVTSYEMPPYENMTLNISKGDTVIWSNEAVPTAKLTIMSKQKLWDNYAGELKWSYKQFNHTFNKSGIFEIYIKEFSRFKQKIIVGPLDTINNTKKKTNQTNVTKPKPTPSINNNTIKMELTLPVPFEKKPEGEAIVMITVTLSLIYVFERKIK